MAWIAAAAAIGGALLSSDASNKAGDTQAEAAGQASKLTQQQFAQTQKSLAPYIGTGAAANNALSLALGLGGASPRERALQKANALAMNQYGHGIGLDPAWAAAEEQWVQNLTREFEAQDAANPVDKGSLVKPFTGADLASEPGYKFGLDQGNNALLNRQAAGGNMFSGNALREASQFNQDYAGTKFDAAYNRDAANKQRIYNFLAGTSAAGQSAATNAGTQGQQAAAVIGNNVMAGANAQAAGMVGGANAWNNALGTIYNGYQQQNALQAYNNRTNTMANQPSTSANGTYYGSDFVGPRLA